MDDVKAYRDDAILWIKEYYPNNANDILTAIMFSREIDWYTDGISLDVFLSYCTASGGNWCGMLLSGIKELFPDVWNAIPDDMGKNAWGLVLHTLLLCNVRVWEKKNTV